MGIRYGLAGLLTLALAGCTKESKTFTLKTVRLNEYRRMGFPAQKLHLEVFGENNPDPLANTGYYPADLTLPASFKMYPSLPMNLYSDAYEVQLWGDSSGHIGTCRINMEEYKIIFPIDMEVKNDSLNISIIGSWQ